MKQIRILTVAMVIGSLLLSLVPFLLENLFDTKKYPPGSFALAIFGSSVALCSSALFFVGLKHFKSAFKHAYAFLCAGVLFHLVSWVTVLLLLLSPTGHSRITLMFAGDIPYLVGTLFIYICLLLYARLLKFQSTIFNLKLILAVVIALGVTAWMAITWLAILVLSIMGAILSSGLRSPLMYYAYWQSGEFARK